MGEKNVHASVSACLLVLVPVVVSVAFSLSLSPPLSLFLSPSLPLSPCAVCVCVRMVAKSCHSGARQANGVK